MGRVEASSRQRVGSQAADRALRVTIIMYLHLDPRMHGYAERCTRNSPAKIGTTRCLKRYLARGAQPSVACPPARPAQCL